MNWKSLSWFFPVVGGILFLVHGLGENVVSFRIDNISLFLLLIAALPFAGEYVETFRFGSVEARFRTLSFADQVFTFVKVLATDRQLTFYSPREAEALLGTAGRYLMDEMFGRNRRQTLQTIREWLKEDEINLKWFAAEIIGFFNLSELAGDLQPLYANTSIHNDWPEWQLNCIWAHSKLRNEYEELNRFLMETNSESNQDWLLDVYLQMPLAGEPIPTPSDAMQLLARFGERAGLSAKVVEKTDHISKQLLELASQSAGQSRSS